MSDEAGTEMSRRLEQIRERWGAPTLREFYNRLRRVRVEPFPSYAAAATYHRAPFRPPSINYLQAILLFDPMLDARWLLLGHWPSPAEEAYTREVERKGRELREFIERATREGLLPKTEK